MSPRKAVSASILFVLLSFPVFVGWDCSNGSVLPGSVPNQGGRSGSSDSSGDNSSGTSPKSPIPPSNAGNSAQLQVRTPVGQPGTLESLVAFPGAEGFGAKSVGGRGPGTQAPRIYHVTNLMDQTRDRVTGQLQTVPGSLREALEATGPRFVVFDVAGPIFLDNEISITNPYITIAGQSAPGAGVAIAHHGLRIKTHDVVLRHLRIRILFDDMTDWLRGRYMDCITMAKSDYEVQSPVTDVVDNVIIDHCSLSWAPDENLDAWNWVRNYTVQWSIIAEAAVYGCDYGPQSYGLLSSQGEGTTSPPNLTSASIHHNLFANNAGRLPEFASGKKLDFRNNVVYNWQNSHPSQMKSSVQVNFVGNHFLSGLDTTNVAAIRNVINVPDPSSMSGAMPMLPRLFILGNLGPLRSATTSGDWSIGVAYYRQNQDGSVCHMPVGSYCVFDVSETGERSLFDLVRPSEMPPVTTQDVGTARSMVLARAGANCPVRDEVDSRIVEEVDYVIRTNPIDAPPNGYSPFNDPRLHRFGPGTGETHTILQFQPQNAPSYECLPRVYRLRRGQATESAKRELLSRISYTFPNGQQLPRDVDAILADPATYRWTSFQAVVPDDAVVRALYPVSLNPGLPADSDADGVPDYFETQIGTNPMVSDSLQDANFDGYLNFEEYLNYISALRQTGGDPPDKDN